MPDHSEQRQEGTTKETAGGDPLRLGFSVYARHAGFPGIGSIRSFIARRFARFGADRSSLGERIQGRWTMGQGAWHGWPSLQWLQTYHGSRVNRVAAAHTSPGLAHAVALGTAVYVDAHSQRHEPLQSDLIPSATDAAARNDSQGAPSCEQIVAPSQQENPATPVLRSAQGKTENISREMVSRTSLSLDHDLSAKAGSAAANKTQGEARTKSLAAPPDVSAHSQIENFATRSNPDQENLNRSEETMPLVRAEQTVGYDQTIARPDINHHLQMDADQASLVRCKGPVYVGPAIFQRSTFQRATGVRNLEAVSEAVASRFPAEARDSSETRANPGMYQLASPLIPRLTPSKENAFIKRRVAEDRKSSPESSTAGPVPAATGRLSAASFPSVSDGCVKVVATDKPVQLEITKVQHHTKQPSQLTSSMEVSNRDSPTAPLLQAEGGLSSTRANVQRPSERAIHRVETLPFAQRKPMAQSQGGRDGSQWNVSKEPGIQPSARTDAQPQMGGDTARIPAVLPNSPNTKLPNSSLTRSSAAVQAGTDGLYAALPLMLSPRDASGTSAFRSLTLRSSGTPFTPVAKTFGARLLQRHQESPITHLGGLAELRMGEASPRPVILHASDSFFPITEPGAPMVQGERVSESVNAMPSGTQPTRSEGVTDPLVASSESRDASRAVAVARPVGNSAGPVLPATEASHEPIDVAASHVERLPMTSAQHLGRSADPVFRNMEQPLRADRREDVVGPVSAREFTIAGHRPGAGHGTSANPVSATSADWMPFAAGQNGQMGLRQYSSPIASRPSISPGTTSDLQRLASHSSFDLGDGRISLFRKPAIDPFRSLPLTHRASGLVDRLQRSPDFGSTGSSSLALAGANGPGATSAGPAGVQLPDSSTASSQIHKTSQGLKNVDIAQLANRVYDLLVQRLASERQRRGL